MLGSSIYIYHLFVPRIAFDKTKMRHLSANICPFYTIKPKLNLNECEETHLTLKSFIWFTFMHDSVQRGYSIWKTRISANASFPLNNIEDTFLKITYANFKCKCMFY